MKFIASLLYRAFVRMAVACASHARTNSALVEVILEGATSATMRLLPYNSDGKAVLDTFFTAHGAKTTVALTQEDAGRDGMGETSEAYKAIKAVFS